MDRDRHTGESRGRQSQKNFRSTLTFEMLFAGNLLFLRITWLPESDALTVYVTLSHPYATVSLPSPQIPQL